MVCGSSGVPHAVRGDCAVSRLHDMARAIIEQGSAATPKDSSGVYNLADWIDASQQLLDGDPSDLEYMVERADAWEDFLEWCAGDPKRADEDFRLWFENKQAVEHLRNMGAEKRAKLEKEWVG